MTSDPAELRRRLRRIGRRPAADRVPAVVPRGQDKGLPPGEEVLTPLGAAYRIESSYPLDHFHGPSRLSDLLAFEPRVAAAVAGQPELEALSHEQLAFVDLETTGLVGGAGTIAFLVGIGTLVGAEFRLRQYFLRELTEEGGMLQALQGDLEAVEAFVTFNGRAFDIPLLENRYVIGLRRRWNLTARPHLDLLYPARRLWRRELPDCRLGTLERRVLTVERSTKDVPGDEIPGIYLDYLRTRDATEIARVVYHNAVDILSLVGVAAQVLSRHSQSDPSELSASEALAVARWHQDAGRSGQAEAAYRTASVAGEEAVRLEALRRYTAHLKREKRYEQAIEGWQAWSALAPDDPRPCVELAKAFEWRYKDLGLAQRWAQAALVCLSHWPAGWRRDQAWGELEHRLARLARKIKAG